MNKVEKMEHILTKLIVDKTIWISDCNLKPLENGDWESGVVVKYGILGEHIKSNISAEMEKICRNTESVFKMLKPSMELRLYRTSFLIGNLPISGCDSGRPLI